MYECMYVSHTICYPQNPTTREWNVTKWSRKGKKESSSRNVGCGKKQEEIINQSLCVQCVIDEPLNLTFSTHSIVRLMLKRNSFYFNVYHPLNTFCLESTFYSYKFHHTHSFIHSFTLDTCRARHQQQQQQQHQIAAHPLFRMKMKNLKIKKNMRKTHKFIYVFI
jgi:hypothetical protein